MAASNRVAKDKEMASRLKAEGVERHTGICPICYKYMPNGTFYPTQAAHHFMVCTGPAKRSSSNGYVSAPRSDSADIVAQPSRRRIAS